MDPTSIENKQYDQYFIDIFRSWTTCRDMLADRGYTIPLTISKAENNDFYTLYQNIDAPAGFNNYDILGTRDNKKVLVKFTLDKESVNRQDIIGIRTNVNETYGEDTNIIYIVKNKPNTFVYKEIKGNDEIFLYTEIIFNRTKHRLVPKHVLLTDAEKRDLLTTYDCRDTQIPRMVTTDYIARYFGAKAGDMFKIYRPSPSSGVYITYRVVK
jgi:DNA-directed RNA polymerase I, II, and III subunit RPABC1